MGNVKDTNLKRRIHLGVRDQFSNSKTISPLSVHYLFPPEESPSGNRKPNSKQTRKGPKDKICKEIRDESDGFDAEKRKLKESFQLCTFLDRFNISKKKKKISTGNSDHLSQAGFRHIVDHAEDTLILYLIPKLLSSYV